MCIRDRIVAVDEKWGIGKDGGLLAHLPEDMKYFRETTSGRTVGMGRRTLESFPGGKPLKNRVNMVLSRNESYSPEGVQVYHRAEDVLEALKAVSYTHLIHGRRNGLQPVRRSWRRKASGKWRKAPGWCS